MSPGLWLGVGRVLRLLPCEQLRASAAAYKLVAAWAVRDERGGALGAKQQLWLAGKRGRRRRESTREEFVSLNTQGGGVVIRYYGV